jgi:Flp pilus assembly protein TadD
LRRALAAALLPAMLAACSGSMDPAAYEGPALAGDDLSRYAPSDEPYSKGSEHFARAEYGLAELYFREATEKAPKDSASWIGLAASYDRLSRFDLADRAYQTAIRLTGETAQILNNQGYSYMLRGNLPAARSKLAKARSLEPDNPLVQNNIKLLDGSAKYAKRGAL